MLRGRGKEKLGAVPKAMAEWHGFWSGSEAARATMGSQSSVIFSFQCQVVMAEGWVEGCNTGAGQEETSGWTASLRPHKLPLGRRQSERRLKHREQSAEESQPYGVLEGGGSRNQPGALGSCCHPQEKAPGGHFFATLGPWLSM